MDRTPSPNDPTQYLENLMHVGQQSIKQFDDALAATMGVRGNNAAPRGQVFSPFAFAMDMQRDYFTQFWRFWNVAFIAAVTGRKRVAVQPARGDKRFKDNAWQDTPFYDLLKQSYLLASTQLHELVDHAQVDDRTRLQLRFHARQFIDAMSPSNFPATNPEVIRKAIETRAASLSDGIQNLIGDLQKGRITRVDESAFEVGGNLAVTPGHVIFENELIQLIQYTPQTADVEKTPLLIVPPCINKYYLLDLGAGNSLVEYAVAQGHQVFLISWRSAIPEIGHLTWDDYLTKGPLKAIDVVRDVANVERDGLGFCVGGTILSCAASVLAARDEDKLASLTLLTTMLDFTDTGEIGLLIDHGSVALREAAIGSVCAAQMVR
jgi:polyhydroxyalkanoate synthase